MYIWKHYLDAQSFNLWQSSSKLDYIFINLNFSSRGGHSQTVVNTTAKKFWKTWTVTHLLKVRQNSGCIAGNDGWQFLYQKGHDNMLVDRGEEILFNIVIDSTGARFGGLSCVRLRCQLSFRLNMTSYVLVVSWNACLIKWKEDKMKTWISFLYILRADSGFYSTMGV